MLKRFQSEVTEATDQKLTMKGRLEEYEDKIKKLIKEFEDESKRHIKEVNEIHEHYRGYKTRAQELEQRIEQYIKDCQHAQRAERQSRKELVQMTFENDELEEKHLYLEQKYHALIKRMGASQEDIDGIEEEIMLKNDPQGAQKGQKKTFGGRRGSSGYNNRQTRVGNSAANQVNKKFKGGLKI